MPPSRIVILIPTHESKKYSIKDCLKNVAAQTYPDNLFDALVLINNSSFEFYHYVRGLAIGISPYVLTAKNIGIIEGENKGDILARVVNYGIDFFLSHYEPVKDIAARGLDDKVGNLYFLVLGADVMLPENAIGELLNAFYVFKDAGISCLTCYYRGIGQVLDKIGFKTDGKIPMVVPYNSNITLTPEIYYKHKWFKGIGGDGAMLFPAWIAERVKWREDSYKLTGKGSDLQFCLDVWNKLGLFTYINTRLYTPHMDEDSSLS